MKFNVIVISYNRPRMLKEAIDSVLNQTHEDLRCIIYDDGSDIFDIEEFIKQYTDDRLALVTSPKLTPEERVEKGNTRWADNINSILEMIPREEYVAYLCDDDLLQQDWLSLANHRFSVDPNLHIVLANMYYFNDGEDPITTAKKGFPARISSENDGAMMWWNLGAFFHSMKCFHDEGAKWGMGLDGNAHSFDIDFINALQENHQAIIFLDICAMYRREHENTLSAKLGRVDENGEYYKAGGDMLPEHITTAME